MSALTISDSKTKLAWSPLHGPVHKKTDSKDEKEMNMLNFVSDFTSPADEIKKPQQYKSEQQKSGKRSRPFSHTSENWIG